MKHVEDSQQFVILSIAMVSLCGVCVSAVIAMICWRRGEEEKCRRKQSSWKINASGGRTYSFDPVPVPFPMLSLMP